MESIVNFTLTTTNHIYVGTGWDMQEVKEKIKFFLKKHPTEKVEQKEIIDNRIFI